MKLHRLNPGFVNENTHIQIKADITAHTHTHTNGYFTDLIAYKRLWAERAVFLPLSSTIPFSLDIILF